MDPESERDSIRVAAHALLDSKRFAKYAIWFVTVAVPAVVSWYSSKLDTQRELNDLTHEVGALAGKAAACEMRIDGLRSSIERQGREFVAHTKLTEAEIQNAQRSAIKAYAAALAYEKLKDKKRAASEGMLNGFDRRTVKENKPAGAAADEVMERIALP